MEHLERILEELSERPNGVGEITEIAEHIGIALNQSDLIFYAKKLEEMELVRATIYKEGAQLKITPNGRAWQETKRKRDREEQTKDLALEKYRLEVSKLRTEFDGYEKQIQNLRELQERSIIMVRDKNLLIWVTFVISSLALLTSLFLR